MLGNPTYDIGIFFQQFFIALPGRVFYPGKEQLLIEVKPVYKFFFILIHIIYETNFQNRRKTT